MSKLPHSHGDQVAFDKGWEALDVECTLVLPKNFSSQCCKKNFKYLKGKPNLGVKVNTGSRVNPGFAEIVDFLRGSNLRTRTVAHAQSHLITTPPPIRHIYISTSPIPSPTPPPITSPTPPPIPTPPLPPSPSPKSPPPPPPPPETEPITDESLYEEHSPGHHHFSPSQEQAPSRMPMDICFQKDEEPEAQRRKVKPGSLKILQVQGLLHLLRKSTCFSGEQKRKYIPKHLEPAQNSLKGCLFKVKCPLTKEGGTEKKRDKRQTAGENKGQREGNSYSSVKKLQRRQKEQNLTKKKQVLQNNKIGSLQKKRRLSKYHLDCSSSTKDSRRRRVD
ncbi:hypothetical protein Tco_0291836 [Tanacetum coccineum]